MNAYPAPYGDDVAFFLKCDDDKARIVRDLCESFGVHVLRRAHERYHAGLAGMLRRKGRFMAALQPVGVGCYLFMTRVNFAGVCIVVEKRVQAGHFHPRMALVRLTFDDAVFDDTVIEGDVMRTPGGKHVFLASDMAADCGAALGRAFLGERLERLRRVLTRHHRPDDHDVFTLAPAAHIPVEALRTVFASGTGYPCCAVSFKPVDPRSGPTVMFVVPREEHAAATTKKKKQKNRVKKEEGDAAEGDAAEGDEEDEEDEEDEDDDEEAEVDSGEVEVEVRRELFVLRTSMPDVYELYEQSDDVGTRAPYAYAGVPTMDASRTLSALFATSPSLPRKASFVFRPRFGKWIPVSG